MAQSAGDQSLGTEGRVRLVTRTAAEYAALELPEFRTGSPRPDRRGRRHVIRPNP